MQCSMGCSTVTDPEATKIVNCMLGTCRNKMFDFMAMIFNKLYGGNIYKTIKLMNFKHTYKN